MATTIAVLLSVHVASGIVALVVAPVAMLTAKGGRTHRRWGKVYFWMMAVVAVTAVVLGLHRFNLFLLLLAVFSFYNAFSGYRALYRKRPREGQGPRPWDHAAAAITFVASAALVILGALQPGPTWRELGIVPVVFGVVGLILSGRQLWRFARPSGHQQAWWFSHMGGMLGSYIATVTAFSTVNLTMLPPTIRWLWPVAIGVPLIFAWIAYYRRRFDRASGAATAWHAAPAQPPSHSAR